MDVVFQNRQASAVITYLVVLDLVLRAVGVFNFHGQVVPAVVAEGRPELLLDRLSELVNCAWGGLSRPDRAGRPLAESGAQVVPSSLLADVVQVVLG